LIEINFKTLKEKIMYALKNKVQLIGHLGKNPEVKTIDNGKKVARVSLATSESYKNLQDEKVTETQWHNIVAWGKLAEILEQYTTKGSEICVEGKLNYRDYTDKDGVKRNTTEIVVNEILLLDKKGNTIQG
jgi:single-strand DNA-binding protein